MRSVSDIARDLRYALRMLRNKPLFAVAVVAILALGIGAVTAVFSIVDGVLLRPLPFPSAGRLVRIEEATTKDDVHGVPAADYLRLASRTDLFGKTAAFVRDDVAVTGIGEPTQAVVKRISAGVFSMLGVHARLGRALLDADENAPNVAVLSDRFWQSVFRADPSVIGRTLRLSGEPYTITGIMGPDFEFPDPKIDIWIPLRVTPSKLWLGVVARVRPGVAIPQVQSALKIAARRIEREDPEDKAGLRIVVSPWRETPAREYELTLVFVLAAVGLVMLIACVNVAGLLLSRVITKQKEMAIRASLGAGRGHLARQLIAEGLVLAALGSAAGISIAQYLLHYLIQQLARVPVVLPYLQRVAIDQRVLLFNTGLCLTLACVISLAPILWTAKTDLQAVLRAGQGAGASRASTGVFSVLITTEAAFAFLLLAGSGLMIRSLVRLEKTDHGFHPDHVLTMRVPVGTLRQLGQTGKYDTKPQQMAYYHELVETLHRIPGVKALAVVNNLPLSDVGTSLLGRGPARTISPEYFTVMGTRLIAGRFFKEADRADSPGVAIINERFAKELFPGQSAVGRKLPIEGSHEGPTVVGVVENAPQQSYEKPPEREMYLPYRQFIFAAFMSTIVVRTSGDPLALAGALKKAVWAVDPDQPILKIEPLNDVIAGSIWRPRFSAWIFSVLGGLALVLTSAGIYAVIAYTTGLRKREVGIRVALGAAPRDVVAVIVRGAMIPLACGLIAGAFAALLLSRTLASLLYEISNTDAVSFWGAGALLLAIGALASALPAWRAATNDPLNALKME